MVRSRNTRGDTIAPRNIITRYCHSGGSVYTSLASDPVELIINDVNVGRWSSEDVSNFVVDQGYIVRWPYRSVIVDCIVEDQNIPRRVENQTVAISRDIGASDCSVRYVLHPDAGVCSIVSVNVTNYEVGAGVVYRNPCRAKNSPWGYVPAFSDVRVWGCSCPARYTVRSCEVDISANDYGWAGGQHSGSYGGNRH